MRPTPGLVSLILTVCAALSVLYWWQASRPVVLVDALSDHLSCVSYAPFHQENHTPFDKSLYIDADHIDADLARLSKRFDCVRIYSVSQGLHETPRLAEKHGMKVLLGIWIGRIAAENEREITKGIDTARKYPSAIRGIIVGNEVLLRGEQPPAALRGYIERVRAAVPNIPITYADVWEFWLRHADLADAVSYITVHILPYWEDRPVPVEHAVGHVSHIYQHVKERLPGKDIMIGETGWPSYGRQRQGAVPNLVNQARFIREFEVRAELEKIPYNVIEAFDQHWKRKQEGAVGGYWGLFNRFGEPKFPFKGPVAEAPAWSLAAACAAAGFFVGFLRRWRTLNGPDEAIVLAIVSVAGGGANLAVWRDLWMANRNWSEWTVTVLYAALLALATFQFGRAVSGWCAGGIKPPQLAPVSALVRWARRNDQSYVAAARVLGALRFAFLFGAALVCLLLVFDGRYRDFPVALYAVPTVGLSLLAWLDRKSTADLEEILLASWIAISAPWIAIAEHVIASPHEPWGWADNLNPQSIVWAGLCLLLAGSVLMPVILELRTRQGERAEQEAQGRIIPVVKD
ncbi:glycoside hydrolase family 17 protein [Methylomagnum sp.]